MTSTYKVKWSTLNHTKKKSSSLLFRCMYYSYSIKNLRNVSSVVNKNTLENHKPSETAQFTQNNLMSKTHKIKKFDDRTKSSKKPIWKTMIKWAPLATYDTPIKIF